MNFLKTQVNSFALCRKQAVNCFLVLAGSLFIFSHSVFAKNVSSLADILKQKKMPAGVVIEIVTDDEANLEWALPRARQYIKKLRNRFPQLPVAIVSHGAEQFALTNEEKEDNKEIHSLVQSLVKDDVPVHVCETYAGWRGMNADDFPGYVNVAAAGPAQVNDYISLGYQLIIISDDDEQD